METIEFKGVEYPALQAKGFAAQYAFPAALQICKGNGVDVGCNRLEWCLPGAAPVDPAVPVYPSPNVTNDAYNLGFPHDSLDYVFSSHCYEHLVQPLEALSHWFNCLKDGGVLFLYLPNMDYQEYWQPWNNRKHAFYLNPEIMEKALKSLPWKSIFVTKGYDINGSFYAIATK